MSLLGVAGPEEAQPLAVQFGNLSSSWARWVFLPHSCRQRAENLLAEPLCFCIFFLRKSHQLGIGGVYCGIPPPLPGFLTVLLLIFLDQLFLKSHKPVLVTHARASF